MSLDNIPHGKVYSDQFTTYATPVHIEELKAGLRAYRWAVPAHNALRESLNNSKIDIVRSTPEEIISLIVEHAFADLQEYCLIQWSVLYGCGAGTCRFYDVGTIYQHAMSIDKSIQKELLRYSDNCPQCVALRTTSEGIIESLLFCEDCTACHEYTLNDVQQDFRLRDWATEKARDEDDWLDSLVDLYNPIDDHPCYDLIRTHLHTHITMRQAAWGLAEQWHGLVAGEALLTQYDHEILREDFGLACQLTHDVDRTDLLAFRGVTAILYVASDAQPTELYRKRWIDCLITVPPKQQMSTYTVSLLTIPALSTEQRRLFQKAMNKLYLDACGDFHRRADGCLECGIGIEWPQLVSLSRLRIQCGPW